MLFLTPNQRCQITEGKKFIHNFSNYHVHRQIQTDGGDSSTVVKSGENGYCYRRNWGVTATSTSHSKLGRRHRCVASAGAGASDASTGAGARKRGARRTNEQATGTIGGDDDDDSSPCSRPTRRSFIGDVRACVRSRRLIEFYTVHRSSESRCSQYR